MLYMMNVADAEEVMLAETKMPGAGAEIAEIITKRDLLLPPEVVEVILKQDMKTLAKMINDLSSHYSDKGGAEFLSFIKVDAFFNVTLTMLYIVLDKFCYTTHRKKRFQTHQRLYPFPDENKSMQSLHFSSYNTHF